MGGEATPRKRSFRRTPARRGLVGRLNSNSNGARRGCRGGEGGGYRAEEILSVDPCADGNRWQVGLEIRAVPDELQGQQAEESQESREAMADQLFFTIVKLNGVFFVQGVSSRRQPGCAGRDESVH